MKGKMNPGETLIKWLDPFMNKSSVSKDSRSQSELTSSYVYSKDVLSLVIPIAVYFLHTSIRLLFVLSETHIVMEETTCNCGHTIVCL